MNRDWLFYYGDPEYIKAKGTVGDQTYRGSRAENARGPARRDFDDSGWRTVHAPHDFVFEHGQQPDKKGTLGEKLDFPFDRGSAWYRRYFKLDEADLGKRITLLFDSVSTHCKVYVNSFLLKENNTSGIGFEVDLTDVAHYGGDLNCVSVYCDCHDYEAWYYEPGGIDGSVYLCKTDNLAVELWGTFVHSDQKDDGTWDVTMETTLYNNYLEEKKAKITSKIFDQSGKEVASLTTEEMAFPSKDTATAVQVQNLKDPKLWSCEERNMYEMKTFVELGGKVVDEYTTAFGIRKIEIDPNKGMHVNGKYTKIFGFANHKFNLGVGEAVSPSMCEFQMRTIMEMGGNGFRTSHSPFSPAIYDYCDKYGLLVMDENRVFHSSEIRQDEVQRIVKRDRNHPSVLFYSLYNEEDTLTRPMGPRIFKSLRAAAEKVDNTRPFSGATSYGLFTDGAYDGQDMLGINHQTINYDNLHKKFPHLPIYTSEMVFGIPDLKATIEREFVLGGYYFTAWPAYSDRPGRWCDALGHMLYGANVHKAVVKKDEPHVKAWPEWVFYPEEAGQTKEIEVISNGDEVELFLDGKSLGKKPVDDIYVPPVYSVAYQPGTMKAVSYKGGKVWAEDTFTTAGAPAAVKLVCENPTLKNDNEDVAIVTAYIVDKDGNVCKRDTGTLITFGCNEAGELITATSLRRDGYLGQTGNSIRVQDGVCQIFYRSMAKGTDLVVTAEASGLKKGEISIKREMTGAAPAVHAEPNPYIVEWQIDKFGIGEIDQERMMKEHAIERWEIIDIQGTSGQMNGLTRTPWSDGLYPDGTKFNLTYHAYSKVPVGMSSGKGQKLKLFFEGFDGMGDAYVVGKDGKRAHAHQAENSAWAGHYRPELVVDCDQFAPGEEVEVWCFFTDPHRVSGVSWPVRWCYM